MTSELQLVPLNEELVRAITPWWSDPETKKWIGGYPASKALELSQSPPDEFRGRKVLKRSALVGLLDQQPVSLVDFELYEDASAGVGLVVGPNHRKQGWGRETLRRLADSKHVAGIKVLFAGIEPKNVASVRCFQAAGFIPRTTEPDHEGIIYFDLYLHENARYN